MIHAIRGHCCYQTSFLQQDLNRITQIKTTDCLEGFFSDWCFTHQLDNMSFILLQPTSVKKTYAYLFTNRATVVRAQSLKTLNKSLIFQELFKQKVPLYWMQSDLFQAKINHQNMLLSNQPHAKHRGISIPIYNCNFTWGILSAELNVNGSVSHLLKIAPYIYYLSLYIFQAVQRILFEHPHAQQKNKKLSKREKECLFWVSEGKTSWEISHILGIKERTVNYHLAQLAQKLGTCNRYQALARVLFMDLMTLNYDEIYERRPP